VGVRDSSDYREKEREHVLGDGLGVGIACDGDGNPACCVDVDGVVADAVAGDDAQRRRDGDLLRAERLRSQ
jgi:hypothetical protein